MKKLLLLLLAVCTVAATLEAEEKVKDKVVVKALKPEVQTAAWARKWWMPRHKQKLADLKKQERVDLLMVGDSITHGWEGGGQQVWKKFYAERHPFNIGFSGDRTEHVLWRLQNGAVEGISPKLTVLMIGTNNAGHRRDKPENTAAGIKAIVGELRKRLPKSKVLVLAIFPRGKDDDDALRKLNVKTNAIVAKLADNKHVFFLDINQTFLDDKGGLPTSVMPDRLHPNAKGYQMWAEAMEPTIKKLLKD